MFRYRTERCSAPAIAGSGSATSSSTFRAAGHAPSRTERRRLDVDAQVAGLLGVGNDHPQRLAPVTHLGREHGLDRGPVARVAPRA